MAATLRLATASPEETRAIGGSLADLLQAGDVVSLSGDLGSGKTTLIQGIARGLGVDQPVLSPTFTLIREYRGRLPVYHLDVYRLNRLQDVLDLGFDEYLDGGGVTLIEWGDAIEAMLPEDNLRMELAIPDDLPVEPSERGEPRTITVTAAGRRWAERWERVEAALGPRPGEA